MAYSVFEPMTLEQMVARVQKYHPGDDYKLVQSAYTFAAAAHAGQARKSGEPYFTHPLYVASILTEVMIDAPTIAAGLLHDTIEDCEGVDLALIEQKFGGEVARLVDGVTKLEKLDFADREELQAESLRKMILAMGKDIRVVLIKLADRLHNMRTLMHKPEERRIAIARETLDIYAPLAHRLGVYAIKQELEDLCLMYLDSSGYQNVARNVGMKRAEREETIRQVIAELSQMLTDQGIRHYDIDGRPKHLYSIYRKMVLQNKPFDQIYDLIAIRVLVDTVQDCYAVLGIVHTLWTPMPQRLKDYIAMPKTNMYQSLHTTVIGGRKIPFPFEIQIRTWDMHRVAEYGIAAHWRYKEASQTQDNLDKKLNWLRQILDWQSEIRDSHEFLDSLKVDLFSEEVFLFTPKGDVISMQRGATPLDFAYRIHSEVGNRCVGAKVNGRIVPLGTELQTGDRVEIMTSQTSKGPSMDWLNVVKTQQARSKIRGYFRRELRGENVTRGRDMIEHECKRRGSTLSALWKPEFYAPILAHYAFGDPDDILGAVGYGGIASSYVVSRLLDESKKNEAPPPPPKLPETPPPRNEGKPSHGIFVKGQPGMLVRFAQCCTPLPGDDITGYITRGRGVTVHKADCVNMTSPEEERVVEVSWADTHEDKFIASMLIVASDRLNLLGEMTVYVGEMGVPVRAASSKVNKDKTCTITMSVQVASRAQLDQVIRQLSKRSDVLAAHRSGK